MIFGKFLIYRNYKIFLIIFYSIIGLLIYLNWNLLSELWLKNIDNINRDLEEPISIFVVLYYCFFSFYVTLFIFSPLLIFDKRYENDYKVKINLPKINKENSLKAFRDVLLFVSFPVISILGILIWILFDIAFTSFWYILNISTLIFISLLIVYFVVLNIYKLIKKQSNI